MPARLFRPGEFSVSFQTTAPSRTQSLPTDKPEAEIQHSDSRVFRARNGCTGCSICGRGSTDKINSIVRAWRIRLCPIFRSLLYRLCRRKLHDRGGLPKDVSSGSAVLSPRDRQCMVQARIGRETKPLDTGRLGSYAIQLLGNSRQFDGCSNLERLLSR